MGSERMWQSLAVAADPGVDPDVAEVDAGVDDEADSYAEARSDSAERLLRRFLALCENPRTSARVLSMVRGALEHEGSGRRFYSLFNGLVLSPVMRLGGLQGNAIRGELVASQLVGLAMMRYVIKVEPICSMDREAVVAQMAPAIRATLNG